MRQQADFQNFDLLIYYDIINRPRLTRIILTMMSVSTAIIGVMLYSRGSERAAMLITVFCVFSLILLFLNLRGRQRISMIGMLGVVPVLLTMVMIQGQGLHDVGMWAFSLYMIVAPLLMGKRFLPYSWIVSVLAVVLIYLSESYWKLAWTQDNVLNSDYVDLGIVLIVLTVGAAVFWIVMSIIETTMARVVAGERQIKEAYDLTLEGWSRALEMRDKETEGHSRRVTDLTLKIARQLGLSGDEMFQIRRGSLLHDIGKMAIPDSILHKPGPLTEAEWDVIKRHPEAAYEMLKDIEFLQPAMDIPLYHHEQWDGNGYPFGISGEDIPLAARIFTVVDNWDALLSDRPYRPAWEQEKVIAYIQKEVGKIFDPLVVDAFLVVVLTDAEAEQPQRV